MDVVSVVGKILLLLSILFVVVVLIACTIGRRIRLRWVKKDMWVGCYIDRSERLLYICLLPTLVIILDTEDRPTDDAFIWRERVKPVVWEVPGCNGCPLRHKSNNTNQIIIYRCEGKGDGRIIFKDTAEGVNISPEWCPLNRGDVTLRR